jgi:hypothetical protein
MEPDLDAIGPQQPLTAVLRPQRADRLILRAYAGGAEGDLVLPPRVSGMPKKLSWKRLILPCK